MEREPGSYSFEISTGSAQGRERSNDACEGEEKCSASSEADTNARAQNDVGISGENIILTSHELARAWEFAKDSRRRAQSPKRSSNASEAVQGYSASSEAPNAGAQNDVDTSGVEIIPITEVPSSRGPAPDGLQRKHSQIGEEKIRNILQKPPHQSETNVCDVRYGLPQARSEGGQDMSVVEGNARESDNSLTSTRTFLYEEQWAMKDKTIAELRKKADRMENLSNHFKGKFRGLQQDYDELSRIHTDVQRDHKELQRDHKELQRDHNVLQRSHEELSRAYVDKEAECAHYDKTAQSYHRMKDNMTKENIEKEKVIGDLRGELEQVKQECGTLQNQMSLYEQQHANVQSRGGSHLEDVEVATPALLVSALNGVKNASNIFVTVLRSCLDHAGFDSAIENFGAVSRNGHSKFQYQALICRSLLGGLDFPSRGLSEDDDVSPTTYFCQYQMHDLKKTDIFERLLNNDPEIDGSLHEFCFRQFLEFMEDADEHLTDRGIDLRQQVQNKQHPRGSKLYVSFCKVAVSVWLLQRLAFSFLHPPKLFVVKSGDPFDPNRMQSVVPLDEPDSDEEVQLRVGFYVLPGFDIGGIAIPCEVYVALK